MENEEKVNIEIKDYVELSRARNIIEKFKDKEDDTKLSFEFIMASFFPTIWENIQNTLKGAYTTGYINGLNDAVDNGDKITVSVPRRRIDISIKEDLIEEVGRIYGVNNIEGRLPNLPIKAGSFDKQTRNIRNKMVDLGLNETLSYILVNDKEAKDFTKDDTEIIKKQKRQTDKL